MDQIFTPFNASRIIIYRDSFVQNELWNTFIYSYPVIVITASYNFKTVREIAAEWKYILHYGNLPVLFSSI